MATDYPLIVQLCRLLENKLFPSQLYTACKTASLEHDGPLFLHIGASVGTSKGPTSDGILLACACSHLLLHEQLLTRTGECEPPGWPAGLA